MDALPGEQAALLSPKKPPAGKGFHTPLAKHLEKGYIDSLFFLQSNNMNAMSTQPALTGSHYTKKNAAKTHAPARSCGLGAHPASTALFVRIHVVAMPAKLRLKEVKAENNLAQAWYTEGNRIMSHQEGQPVHREQGCPSHVLFGAGAPCGHGGGAGSRFLFPALPALHCIFTPQHPSGRNFS